MIHLQDLLKTSWRDPCKMSWRSFKNVLKTSWQNILKRSWRNLQGVFKMCSRHYENVSKTSWRCFWKTSWGRHENVIWLRQIYSSWRRFLNKGKEVFKTSSRRHNQDCCLLSYLSLLSRKSFVWSGLKFNFFHRWFNASKWDVLTDPLSISNDRLDFRFCFKAL